MRLTLGWRSCITNCLKVNLYHSEKKLVDNIAEELKIVKKEIHNKKLLFKITYEPSAAPGLRRFAEQVKVIFNSVGLNVVVEPNSVYLFDLPIPVEWGGNTKNNLILSKVISAFEPAFVDVSNHKKRITRRFPKNFIRMHIAGQMQFEPSGIVKVE